ncbi:peptide chain release factor N(5)-glutamine methyltransferase [Paracoccus sp. P2]|uniref:Release factor glutamine methyltransferase n=1 Tax=Paracoccus pantotrophus TaxID=82367 RepID=A0A7H9BUX9_PARPN|nr:peptide chain release factor N(5)-glutamine methyltransferase [Paracoccus pantotrophus]MDF3855491.1 peptide chain release factor N(5)-glutamine methyltransferase [Paracoccus pantotrophus]QLH14799.1 peptide chain release factor N(5)-glutamine methyltransferase [Paracoccus pantotrophus]RDD99776.1 peptide chain release factor N(5)-glutamine methyltransferase [Paracoccus pantotrophus]RNI18127.1 peptide chain release factor N(5)-glutamine methyltransferase [Paracoccus pantotrophus]WGR64941.1 pep
MTGAEALRQGAARLAQAGVPGAAEDARLLLAHALDLPRHQLTGVLAAPLPPEALRRFDAALAARAARQPVSQILGRRAFWKHEFRVTRDTLDPRPETETLVEAALAEPFASVLDLGTGTGAILISLLAERPGTRGLGTEISPAALAVARENAKVMGVCADFLESDWFASVTGQFDLIVSNPPYIALAEMAQLTPEVREWEPQQALTDGADGLSAYRAIAAGAPAHLAPGGRLMVEIGPTQGAAVAALMRAAGLAEPRILPDLDGRDRVVAARKPL